MKGVQKAWRRRQSCFADEGCERVRVDEEEGQALVENVLRISSDAVPPRVRAFVRGIEKRFNGVQSPEKTAADSKSLCS